MNDKIFFALIKIKGADIYGGSGATGGEPPFEIYLVNNSDNPITVNRIASGGFKTYDNDLVVMNTPKDDNVDIHVESHGYVRYMKLYIDDFDGITQHEAYVEIEGITKKFEFTLTRGVGILDTKIPCMDNYGRIIRSRMTDV